VRIGARAAYADPHSWSALPPESAGGCDGHVSTGLGIEINPVGSLRGELASRLAKTPMMSVPFYPLDHPSLFKLEKSKRFANRFFLG
jgi:hypothetical protein